MLFHVIDDEPIICEYINDLLKSLDHEALTFHSPMEYLDFLKSDKYVSPDAVFTDLSMPSMGGCEMIKRIRIIYPDQKFIIMSGKPEIRDEYENVACLFLNKPFRIEQFEAVVAALHTQKAA